MIPASPMAALPKTFARVHWEHGRYALFGGVIKLSGCHPEAGTGREAPCGRGVDASLRVKPPQRRVQARLGKKLGCDMIV